MITQTYSITHLCLALVNVLDELYARTTQRQSSCAFNHVLSNCFVKVQVACIFKDIKEFRRQVSKAKGRGMKFVRSISTKSARCSDLRRSIRPGRARLENTNDDQKMRLHSQFHSSNLTHASSLYAKNAAMSTPKPQHPTHQA